MDVATIQLIQALASVGMFFAGILGVTASPTDSASGGADVGTSSTAIELTAATEHLEHELEEIESELQRLARLSPKPGVGPVGFVGEAQLPQGNWLQIDFGREEVVEELVLVPSLWRSTDGEFVADGFPTSLRVIAGGEGIDQVDLAHLKGGFLPRAAPLVVSFPPTQASWIRLELVSFSPRVWDGRENILQLSEICVFNAWKNVALEAAVTTSLSYGAEKRRGIGELVDGLVPFSIEAQRGESSLAMLSELGFTEKPVIRIDLGVERTIDRIRFHTVESGDSIPQAVDSDFGVPRLMEVWAIAAAGATERTRLVDIRVSSANDVGPFLVRDVPPTRCKIIEVIVPEPYIRPADLDLPGAGQVGFGEIELFEQGVNVAQGAEVSANFKSQDPNRYLAGLTDGRNAHGEILPLRTWLGELARRHDLESLQKNLRAELDARYVFQRKRVRFLGWLVTLLTAALLGSIWFGRAIRKKKESGLRERLAADLHDDLGVNLHTIGLLSDLAKAAVDDRTKLVDYLAEIRRETERSGRSVRGAVEALDQSNRRSAIVPEMQRLAERILVDRRFEFSIQGEEELANIPRVLASEIVLFFKESLVNIVRHSDASEVSTEIHLDAKGLLLKIRDDGVGLSDESAPPSLKRRARLLGGRLKCISEPGEGLLSELWIPRRRFRSIF